MIAFVPAGVEALGWRLGDFFDERLAVETAGTRSALAQRNRAAALGQPGT